MAGAVHLVDVTKELELKPQRPVCDSASIHVKKATKLSSADGTVRIKILRGHLSDVKSCHFCNNDTKILSSSFDRSIVLWDTDSGEQIKQYKDAHDKFISEAHCNDEITRILSSGWDKKLHLRHAQSGMILWTGTHEGIVTCCALSTDSKHAVSGSDFDHSVKIWDVSSGHLIHEIKDMHTNTLTSCKFTEQGDRIVTTSMDKTTRIWDLRSLRNTITLTGHKSIVADACFSPDARSLITVSWDKSIRTSDVSTGAYRQEGAEVIEKAHESSISCCCYSPDGKMFCTGSYDNTVTVWEVGSKQHKIKLAGHLNWVEDVQFSRCQNWILSCSMDRTIRVWNIRDSEQMPVVVDKKRAFGLVMQDCTVCGKQFSLSSEQKLDARRDNMCVVCRLHISKESSVLVQASRFSPQPPPGI